MDKGCFTGKVAIITGASSGIGLETAKLFAKEGAFVVLAARRESELNELKAQIENSGGRAEVVPTDVSRKDAVYALVRDTHARHGQLDILVNNAGIGGVHVFLEMTDEEVELMVNVNFNGVLWGCRAAIPMMVKHGSGHIVNVSSINGLKGTPYSTIYSATKFGIRGLTEALRLELKGTGVSLSSVNPGVTETAMSDGVIEHFDEIGESIPGKPMAADKVAAAIRDAVIKNKAETSLTAGGLALVVINRISTRLASWMVGTFGPKPEVPDELKP